MIDYSKKITTRCGYPVEIWTTEASVAYPIQGCIYLKEGKSLPFLMPHGR